MALYVEQYHNDVLNSELEITVPAGMDDREYLEVKATSAERHGWDVKRQGKRVTATKFRWGNTICRRVFEVR